MDNQTMKSHFSLIHAISRQIRHIKAHIVLLTALVFSSATMAIEIANEPLFLADGATPNIMFVLDDSGSMDWEILTVPHYEAYNYDRDANRSWARGGWLNWSSSHNNVRKDGDWVSYAGFCNDRNADGICYNRFDLDGDGDDHDHEKAGNPAVAANPNWVLRLRHLYYWEYTNGYCWVPSGGSTDASDYLPNVGNIIAFLTGSTTAQAHVYNGTSWGGSNNPGDGSFSDTDPVYNYEHWSHRNSHYDVGDWANNPAQAAAKATCLSVTGNEWRRSNSGRILHHGPDQHAGLRTSSYPTWSSSPWVSAGSVDNLTGAYTAGNVGGYHQEYTKNIGTAAIAATGSLDINGDGLFNTPNYKERDDWGVKRVNYEYLNEEQDNAYRNPKGPWGSNAKPWETCSKGDPAHFSSVSRCHYLLYADYPSGYPYDPLNPAVAATSPWLNGNQNIVTLPSFVPRAIKSSWGNPPSTDVRFDTITWAPDPSRGGATSPVGTHHAMNRYDNWPLISDWRIRSADFNVLYYSPNTDYQPWPGLINGNPGAQANFHAVYSNPQPGTVGYLAPTKDLVRPHAPFTLAVPNVPYQEADEAGYVYEIWHDDAGFWSGKPEWSSTDHCGTSGWRASSNGITGMLDPATGIPLAANDRVCSKYHSAPNGIVDLWDKHDRVTVYTDKIVVQTVRRTPHILGEPIGSDASKSYFVSDTRILNEEIYLAGTVYPVDGFCETVLGVDPDNPANCRTVAQVQQNAANWYEFSRRRSFVAKGAIAKLITDLPDLRYGLYVTSATGSLVEDLPVGAGPYGAHNDNIISNMYDYTWPAAGTPLRTALQRVGEYFKGNKAGSPNPVTESCQKNFALMMTDGYWSGGPPTGIGEQDGDGYNPTLADVAKKYYDEDLNLALDNKVPTDTFDTNNKQHLTTIGIGFGVTGSLVDDNDNGWPGNVAALPFSSKTEASNWGNPASNKQNKINDLWHAAYNSRGLYLNAKTPAELITQLTAALRFASAKTGSASGVTLNEITKTADTRVYQSLFDSDDWSGDVIAYSIDASNALVPEWHAQAQLDDASVTYDTRNIFTYNDASTPGVAFRWASLNATQKSQLQIEWATGATKTVAFGEKQLNYIRGLEDPLFRTRAHKLGDIAHSKPLYVGAPNASYDEASFAGYNAFKASHSARKMIFVGANDGMLHAFDATTGDEKYAYVPNILIPKLNALTHKTTLAQDFVHQFLVDATPVVSDVKFGGAWHSVLVGGLGAGGKGIYALDVTNTPTDESSPNDTVLWEFTDVDMNYSYSEPTITKLANGKWAAIFGNGYAKNSDGNGKSVLYIVDIEDGSLIKKIVASDVSSEDNGLSTPTVVDRDGDFIADNVYAGDLQGNVWRFDISKPLTSDWEVSFDGAPLFTANDGGSPANVQPITQKITVTKHPLGLAAGIMLYVGTGQYIGTADITGSPYVTQSMYGIWDYYDKQNDTSGDGAFVRKDLLQQKVLAELTHSSGELVRVTSDEGLTSSSATPPSVTRDISWLTGQVGDASWRSHVVDKGWFMDLVNTGVTPPNNKGERIITKVIVSAGAVHINTMLPAEDACVGGGTGWPMVLNAENGARFPTTVLDVNEDGTFDTDDYVSYTWVDANGDTQTELVPVSGVRRDGIMTDSALLNLGGDRSLNLTDTSSGTVAEHEVLVPTPGARDSWTQLN